MAIKHLTGINDLTQDDISFILEKAKYYSIQFKTKDFPKILKNKVVANIFFENSTRTKFSFEVAQKCLGAHVLNFAKESSSTSKGESLFDTLKTFEALQADIAVIRHSDDHFIEKAKSLFNFSIINAGAGKNEHPTQTLLDLFTMKEEFTELNQLTVTICGDIKNSRVAKSNMIAFERLGIKVNLCGPESLLPAQNELTHNCKLKSIDDALSESDVIMLLRVQHERHETFELDIKNYNAEFGLNQKRMQLLKEKAIIMHPGPFNRDVEIASDLVMHEKSRIFKQKENGVYTRMAILEWIMTEE